MSHQSVTYLAKKSKYMSHYSVPNQRSFYKV
nr:MAG TPA: hypothetical protein [Bacteriophage sp.]